MAVHLMFHEWLAPGTEREEGVTESEDQGKLLPGHFDEIRSRPRRHASDLKKGERDQGALGGFAQWDKADRAKKRTKGGPPPLETV